MREILFKAKRIDNREWVEGYIVKYPCAVQIGNGSCWYIDVPPVDPDDNGGRYNVDPETVCQYTGLTDRNGRDVFEGDKLHCEYLWYGELYKNDYVVSWKDGNYFLNPIGTGLSDEFSVDTLLSCEVIGNIHDDKENEIAKND